MLTVTVTFRSSDGRRFLTRMLASHVSLAEIVEWARMQCRDGETVAEIACHADVALEDRLQVRIAAPGLGRLSHRLFH